MTAVSLTPTQRAILAHALDHAEGRVEWFPAHANGDARRKVLDGLLKRALIAPKGTGWVVAAAGYDALGVPRPAVNKRRVGGFEARLDQIIANAEGAPSARHDAELDAAVAAVETTWAKPRARGTSKQAEVIRMLQRAEGATIAQIMQATGWQAHTVRGAFAKQRGNVSMTNLQVVNAMLYVAEHGCKWRGLPKKFGNWHTVYTRMRRWTKAGVLDKMFEELQREQVVRIKIEAVSLDSTSIKVHPDGTGAQKKTAHRPSANLAAAGTPRFIWLPRMLERP